MSDMKLIKSIPNGKGAIAVYHDTQTDYIVIRTRGTGMNTTQEFDMHSSYDILQMAKYLSSVAATFSAQVSDLIEELEQ